METVGQILKQAREQRSMSIADVASAVNAKQVAIEAIERNDFQAFAAPVYARGFIKLYARAVGVNPEPLLRHYAALQAPAPALEPAALRPEKRRDAPARQPPIPPVSNTPVFSPGLFSSLPKIRFFGALPKLSLPRLSKEAWLAISAVAGVALLLAAAFAGWQRWFLNRPIPGELHFVKDPPAPYVDNALLRDRVKTP